MSRRVVLAQDALLRALGHETAHLDPHEQIEVLADVGKQCFELIAQISGDDLIEPIPRESEGKQ